MNPSAWQCWCFYINISEFSLIIDEVLQQQEKIPCPVEEDFGLKPCWSLVMYIPLWVLMESGMQPRNAIHRPLWTATVTDMTQQHCSFQYFWPSLWLLHCDLLKYLAKGKQAAGKWAFWWHWVVETPMQIHRKAAVVILKFHCCCWQCHCSVTADTLSQQQKPTRKSCTMFCRIMCSICYSSERCMWSISSVELTCYSLFKPVPKSI